MAKSKSLFDKQLAMSPWQRLFFGAPVSIDAQPVMLGADQTVFVTTGPKVINEIRDYVLFRRNVMLVGPRGTGKSYMARMAVQAIEADPRFGVVATVTLQGDPNKPPSDYFDDGIIFKVEESRNRSRVLPSTVKAPFFSRAKRSANPFEFDRDQDGKLELYKEIAGEQVRVDRLILFWDEGNRSSPAMQNAMLSLLAEGIIRRDGIDYVFPAVSCILTRNPDGYDAQSAKMPSPLIDRFGVQLYVYNPDVATMRNIICGAWHDDLLHDLKADVVAAVKRVQASNPTAPIGKVLKFTNELEKELSQDRAIRMGKLTASKRPTTIRHPPETFTAVLDQLVAIEAEMDGARKRLGFIKETPVTLLADSQVTWAKNCIAATKLLAYYPSRETVQNQAEIIALLILSTWGDMRPASEKPGMQYLPTNMQKGLVKIGKLGASIAHAQRRLGELTRYGTSIRAFVDMLEVLCGDAVASVIRTGSVEAPAPVIPDVQSIEGKLGQLLNHRCEPAFNPDREPEKADQKTAALIHIARAILADPKKAYGIYSEIK